MHYQDLPRRLKRPYVSLTTDFGWKDESVGALKAVIRNICPESIIDDYNHGITPFSVREGAWSMWATLGYAPIGAHVAIVDPGVGTERKPIVIEVRRQKSNGTIYSYSDYLIGPDNGLLIPATNRGRVIKAIEIDAEKISIEPVSPIFHGRDIFAPAAACLASGRYELNDMAKSEVDVQELKPAPYGNATRDDKKLTGELIRIDGYGNVFTNIPLSWVEETIGYGNLSRVYVQEKDLSIPLHRTFGNVGEGELVLTDDAYGRVQIAVNLGDAAKTIDTYLNEALEADKKVEIIIESA